MFSYIITTTLFAWLFTQGFALDLKITPKVVNGLVPNQVNITCQVQENDLGDMKHITLMQLHKDDIPVATMHQNTQMSIGPGAEPNFEVDGNITSTIKDSFMHVTVVNPSLDESSSYTCVVYFLDARGILREARKSSSLTVSNLDTKAAVKYLIRTVSDLMAELSGYKTTVANLVTELSQYKIKTELDKNSSMVREADLQGVILSLNARIDIYEHNLQHMNERENTNVLFTAIHDRTGNPSNGQVLIFREVIINEGGGYNGDSGVFTVPVSGYYLFHVSVLVNDNRALYLDLRTGNGTVLTRLKAGNHEGREDYSDGSCVTVLEAGEQVMPVIKRIVNSYSLYGLEPLDRMHKFYGYLLKAT